MDINMHSAKTNLSRLIAAVEDGEDVIIARNGKPVVKLVLVASAEPKAPRQLGRLTGKLSLPEIWASEKLEDEIAFLMEAGDDFDDPLTGMPNFAGTPFASLSEAANTPKSPGRKSSR